MEKDIGAEFIDLWSHPIPKILDVAEGDESLGVKNSLDAYSHKEVTPGMFNIGIVNALLGYLEKLE